MEPSGQKGIVIDLIRIPSIAKCRRSQTGSRGDGTLRSGRTHRERLRRPRLSRVPSHLIEDFDWCSGIRMIPVVAHPETVDESRAERMVLFEGGNLPLGNILLENVVEDIGLRLRRVVIYISPEEAVLLRKFLVDSSGEIIFANNCLAYIFVQRLIPIADGTCVGHTKHRQILRDLIVNAYRCFSVVGIRGGEGCS